MSRSNSQPSQSGYYAIKKSLAHTVGLGLLLLNMLFVLTVYKKAPEAAECGCERHVMFTCPKSRRPFGHISVMTELINFVDSAQESIHMKIYSFTYPELGRALMRAVQRGVDVRIMADCSSEKYFHDDTKLALLYSSDSPRISIAIENLGGGFAHDKICIVDGKKVWTGSFNFSKHADSDNEENAIILTCPKMVAAYQKHWDRCFAAKTTIVVKEGKWGAKRTDQPWDAQTAPKPFKPARKPVKGGKSASK